MKMPIGFNRAHGKKSKRAFAGLSVFFMTVLLTCLSIRPAHTAGFEYAEYAWTKTMGGDAADVASSVAVDSNGNIYTAGFFVNTVDFDPGPGVDNHTATSAQDIFLTRINADGTYAWTKTMGVAADTYERTNSVAVDSNGNVYVAGHYNGTADFDPGPGVDNHTSAGWPDIFLTRINADGTYAWTKTMGGAGSDIAKSVAVDSNGNVYVAGHFGETTDPVDFDPGPGVDNHTATSAQDIFLTRINADGTYAWTKTMGGPGSDAVNSLAVDSNGNLYAAGYFGSTVDFDPGPGVDNHTAIDPGGSNPDIFLTRFSALPSILPKNDLIVDFGSGIGLWAWHNDAAWTMLHSLSPTLIATGDLDGTYINDTIAVFDPYGLYVRYDNTRPWVRLHSFVPSMVATGYMDGGGKDELIAVFPAYGTYAWHQNMGGWTRLTSLVPEQVVMADMDGDGHDDLIGDFGAMGIWAKYNNGAWTKIIGADAGLMAAGDLDGGGQDELIAYFPAFGGIWMKMNNAGWTKLHALAPQSIVTADLDGTGKDEAIVDFGPVYGIWAKYNNSAWTKLHAISPDSMTTGDLDGSGKYDLVADFGAFGIYVKYNDGAWSNIHTNNPELMGTGNLDGN